MGGVNDLVCLVVSNLVKQLVPDRHFVVEVPASQGFQVDLSSGGNLPLDHHGVDLLVLGFGNFHYHVISNNVNRP